MPMQPALPTNKAASNCRVATAWSAPQALAALQAVLQQIRCLGNVFKAATFVM